MRRAALSLLLFALAAAPASAQWRVVQAPQGPQGPGVSADAVLGEAGPLPRSRTAMLQELAAALGAVHYFTVACDGRGNQYWRDRMIALVEAEAPGDPRLRAAMIQTFNDQYRERERAFADCSPDARSARTEAALRGQTLSEALAEPYR